MAAKVAFISTSRLLCFLIVKFYHQHSTLLDISVYLDAAMLNRHKDIQELVIPNSILTKYKNTAIGKIIQEIESLEQPRTIDLGFMLLLLDENTMKEISINIG